MSYSRWSPTSDVYSYAGDTFTTFVNNGEVFDDPTLIDFKARLLQLRAQGFRVPDCALTRIEREIAQAQFKARLRHRRRPRPNAT